MESGIGTTDFKASLFGYLAYVFGASCLITYYLGETGVDASYFLWSTAIFWSYGCVD